MTCAFRRSSRRRFSIRSSSFEPIPLSSNGDVHVSTGLSLAFVVGNERLDTLAFGFRVGFEVIQFLLRLLAPSLLEFVSE